LEPKRRVRLSAEVRSVMARSGFAGCGSRVAGSLALLASIVACAQTASRSPEPERMPPASGGAMQPGGGSATAAAGTGGGGSGGAEVTAGAAAGDADGLGGTGAVDPEPDECLVVGHWSLASAPRGSLYRLRDGFALSEDHVRWSVVADSDGKRLDVNLALQGPESLLTDNVVGKVSAITASAGKPRVLAIHPVTHMLFDATAVLQAYDELGQPQGDEIEALDIFNRVTSRNPFAVSLDGRLAAFGNYHAGLRDPRMVVLDGDGRPQGAPLRLLDTGDAPTLDCFALTPTKSGVLATFVDAVTSTLHLTEVSGAGQVLAQTEWAVPTGLQCGAPWQEPSGTLLPFVARDAQGIDLSNEVYRYAGSTVVKVASVPVGVDGAICRWLLDGAAPLFVRSRPGGGAELLRLHGADFVPLRGPALPAPTAVMPAVDGRIFIAAQSFPTDGSMGSDLEVYEIRCGSEPE
jgi:hypothetical protein